LQGNQGAQGAAGAQGAQGFQGTAGGGSAGIVGFATATVDFSNEFSVNGSSHIWKGPTGSDFSYSGNSAIALTASGCLLTYTGSTKKFIVQLSVACEGEGGLSGTSGAAIAKNDDLVDAEMFGDAATLTGAMYSDFVTGGAMSWTVQRKVTLASGDTVRPVMAKFDANNDLVVHSLVMNIWEVPD
jgi:hypothetical protein